MQGGTRRAWAVRLDDEVPETVSGRRGNGGAIRRGDDLERLDRAGPQSTHFFFALFSKSDRVEPTICFTFPLCKSMQGLNCMGLLSTPTARTCPLATHLAHDGG